MRRKNLTFEQLISSIKVVHDHFAAQAGKAINISLTLRNWIIGYYVREYEQNGADRAEYGQQLLERIAKELKQAVNRCYTGRYLGLCRQFYEAYPQIRKSLISKSGVFEIRKSPISEKNNLLTNDVSRDAKATPSRLIIPGEKLITQLSFTHIVELIKTDDLLKRSFYEIECIKGNWSVRELKRQINSLYYERSGLSKNKRKLVQIVKSGAEKNSPNLSIRDPYIFEFLGLKTKEVTGESDLEDALLDRLQDFLLELGKGFCFESRQKRILIGDEYFFVDLVFYHRILKCNILIELKVDQFTHEYLGQLNTYVSWYKDNELSEGDNPPIGILLCTRKNHALVEYALAGIDNRMFVSKYQLELPKKEEIKRFLEAELETK